MEEAPRGSRLNLAVLVEIARTVERRDALAHAICAHAVAGLGLAGASISIVNHDAGEARLDSIAAVGQLSSFMADLSMPLDKPTDATRTALGGEPIFVGNPHGVQNGSEPANGVARWRNGFGAHAYAVLGLNVLEGTLGVLTLEWPEPQPFEEEERRNLQLFADVVAIVLRSSTSGSPVDVAATLPKPSCDDAELAAYQLNGRGLLVPEAVAGAWTHAPAVRAWTAVTPAHPEEGSVAFAQVAGSQNGGLACAVGAVSAGPKGGAGEAVSSATGVVRAAVAHGSTPAEILGMVGSSMRSQTSAAWASGVVVELTQATGALEVAEAGAAALLVLGREGRFELVLSDSPPVGASRTAVTTRFQVVLPADRVAMISGGRIASLSDPACVTKARHILETLPDRGGEETARSLLAIVCGEGLAAAVAVFEPLPQGSGEAE